MTTEGKTGTGGNNVDLDKQGKRKPDRSSAKPTTRPLMLEHFIPRSLRGHPFAFWIMVGVILSCASIALSLNTSNPKAYSEMCLLLTIGLVAVPSVVRACHFLMLDWSRNTKNFITDIPPSIAKIDDWWNRELSIFEGSPTMFMAGVAVALIALLGYSLDDYPIGVQSLENAFAACILAASAFAAGVGLCTMVYGTRIIWRFGTAFKISIQGHRFGVLSTGDMLLNCYFLIALTWSVYLSSAVFGIMAGNLPINSWKNPVWILALPSALAALITFVVCQIPLHQRMIEYKRERLMTVETILKNLKISDANLLNADVLSKIRFFEDQKSEAISFPEWPFAFKTLLGSLGSTSMVVLAPIASTIVKSGVGAFLKG